MICTKIQRCDANEAGAIEVTTTSEQHAEAERTQKQKREETVTSDSGGSGRDRARDDGAWGRTARCDTRGRERVWPTVVGQPPECTG